jgi:hypothetical protein
MLIWREASEPRCLEWLQVLVFTSRSHVAGGVVFRECGGGTRVRRKHAEMTREVNHAGNKHATSSASDPFRAQVASDLVYRPFQGGL